MRIKGMSGEEYNVTGQGQGNYNTVGASAGIASFLGLNAGNLLGGCGNARNGGYVGPVEVITSEDKPVSRYEAGMMDKLAAKDSEIALLKSNTYTDQIGFAGILEIIVLACRRFVRYVVEHIAFIVCCT